MFHCILRVGYAQRFDLFEKMQDHVHGSVIVANVDAMVAAKEGIYSYANRSCKDFSPKWVSKVHFGFWEPKCRKAQTQANFLCELYVDKYCCAWRLKALSHL